MARFALKGWRLAALSGGTFVWIALMGQWKWAMETLSVIVVATPFSVMLGLAVGVLAWRSARFERVLNPVLNIAQSLPHFAYMIPVAVFIKVGPKAGAIVTIIFSVPPMIRMTLLGLKKVPEAVIEAAKMSGSTRWQLLAPVRIPTARPDILIGVNQVIMPCLAMAVLASFIHLIPVIMLFGVSDVAVVAAVVVFATVPITRYTIEGLVNVPPELIEAAEMSGATRRQILLHVRLPLALPTMLTGANQPVMVSLFPVIIAAFIGTQDLGHEMQHALSSTDVDKGLALGLAVAFMGLMTDHLITRWSDTRKRALAL